MRVGLIGDGGIAQRHRRAIAEASGSIAWIFDPKHGDKPEDLQNLVMSRSVDIISVCSPTHLHKEQVDLILKETTGTKILCEKPAVLPWQDRFTDDRVSICLPFRYLPHCPDKIKKVTCHMVRDDAYFKTWKGETRNTGGLFYNLFIHYIDLALEKDASFEGLVCSEGENIRMADSINLAESDLDWMYAAMYVDVMEGGGIKMRDIEYLMWVLDIYGQRYGHGKDLLGKKVTL